MNEKHNEFVRKAIHDIGPGLLAQGTVAEQMVAIESLLAGMVGLIANAHGMTLFRAEGLTRAVSVGARERLGAIVGPSVTATPAGKGETG